MADLEQTSQKPNTAPRDEKEKVFSQSRTMRSDMERLFAKLRKEEPPKKIDAAPAASEIHHPSRNLAWKKILVAGFTLLFAATIIAAVKFIKPLALFPPTPPEENREPPPHPIAPVLTPSFFAVENSRSRTIAARDRSSFREFLFDSANETEPPGRITRLAAKIQEGGQERFMTLADFFDYLLIDPPTQFLSRTGNEPLLFIYYAAYGPRAGFAVDTRDFGRTFRDMLSWEPQMLNEFRLLMLGATSTPVSSFEDRTYRNVDWRYLKFPGAEDQGIGYGIFPARNLLIITTSRESFQAVIDRLLSQ